MSTSWSGAFACFDKVIIAIAANPRKASLPAAGADCHVQGRIEGAKEHRDRRFDCLLVDYMKEKKAVG